MNRCVCEEMDCCPRYCLEKTGKSCVTIGDDNCMFQAEHKGFSYWELLEELGIDRIGD